MAVGLIVITAMIRFALILFLSLGVSSQALHCCEMEQFNWFIEEKNSQSVKSCKHLGKVETPKNAGTGFSYDLKAAKKRLTEKASKLGGNTFVFAEGWDSGQRRTVTFVADVYKCN